MPKFRCGSCGEWHDGIPMSYASEAPARFYEIPAVEEEARVDRTSDQFVLDGSEFFVLARIQIPIVDSTDQFTWSVWVCLTGKDFLRASEVWTTLGRESEPPYSGSVGSVLPYYPNTLGLKGQLFTRPVGERFVLLLEPSEHPLALEQRSGIVMARIQDFAERTLHDAAAV